MSKLDSVEDFYQNLALPKACELGKRLFKKYFYEHGQLGATDKKAFAEDITGIEWRYTLKPSTINIPKLENDTYEYLEIVVLEVGLSALKRQSRVASVIQRTIPYPLLIVFKRGHHIAINAADKRINRADSNRIVMERSYDTGWIDTDELTAEQEAFLSDFRAVNFSYRNLYDFYQDAVVRIIALNCAVHSGEYKSPIEMAKSKADRIEALCEIERLHQERDEFRNKLKTEKNLGERVNLNTRVKQLNDSIEVIRRGI